jgi:hypothetical protein
MKALLNRELSGWRYDAAIANRHATALHDAAEQVSPYVCFTDALLMFY